jgi:hypothetical protein
MLDGVLLDEIGKVQRRLAKEEARTVTLEARIELLEADSHPVYDWRPVIDEAIALTRLYMLGRIVQIEDASTKLCIALDEAKKDRVDLREKVGHLKASVMQHTATIAANERRLDSLARIVERDTGRG